MRHQFKLLSILTLMLFIFATPVLANEQSDSADFGNINAHCYHSFAFDFDDTTMTLTNGYASNTVEWLIEDIEFYGDTAVVYQNGEVVSEGYLQQDMAVHIYHGDKLYGIYTIPSLQQPSLSVNTYTVQTTNSSSNNWILPVDNISMADCSTGNINVHFEKNGNNYVHRGIDIASGGNVSPIEGKEIRAVADGTVVKAEYHNHQYSWGYYVKINHEENSDGKNVSTLYAHMQSSPSVSVGTTVKQGDVIGYVGNTGYSSGAHLHFEVQLNNEPVDPIGYLTGATTYISQPSGWQNESGVWYYYEPAGVKVKGWKIINGYTYYFDLTNGDMKTGWQKIDNKWYYFEVSDNSSLVGRMATGWKEINNKWYYLDPTNGSMITGWKSINGYTYYFDLTNGDMKTNWQKIDNKWYYFEVSDNSSLVGRMATGWKVINGYTYYFDLTNGDMKTGWQKIDNKWYYFDSTNGNRITGLNIINGKTYYLDPTNGNMITGWKIINGKTYYFEPSGSDPATSDFGRIYTGWRIINNKTYYFEIVGEHPANDSESDMCRMRTGWTVIGSDVYYFDPTGDHPTVNANTDMGRVFYGGYTENGRFVYNYGGWTKIDDFTYYLEPAGKSPAIDSNSDLGKLRIGWQNINGSVYYLRPFNGIMLYGLQTISSANPVNTTYYFCPFGDSPAIDSDSDYGKMMTGWHDINGSTHYFRPSDGLMLRGWQNIDGSVHYFYPSDGAMLMGWQNIDGANYYFRVFDGAMLTGFASLTASQPDRIYYFCPGGESPADDPDSDLGKQMTGLQNIGDSLYYFDPEYGGIMATGWRSIHIESGDYDRWVAYYFDDTGVFVEAWHNYRDVLADNTWEQIKLASERGLASHIWNVGDEKSFVLSTGEVVTVQIYGFNHDDLSNGGKAGITFGLKNIMRSAYALDDTATNVGGYNGTDMYQWLNTTMFGSLPEELRNAIKYTDKKTSVGGGSTEICTSNMLLFLFSEVECFGTTYHSVEGEGEQYAIFTDDASRIKTQPDLQIIEWWLRSPRKDDTCSFGIVHATGHAGYVNAAWPYAGLCFGFCI